MASVASQLVEEVTAHAQSDSLEDAREICADGTYCPNKLRIFIIHGHIITSAALETMEFGLKQTNKQNLHDYRNCILSQCVKF